MNTVPLKRLIDAFDKISHSTGEAFSWAIVVLVFGISYEVIMRYLFNSPTSWAFDMSFILYGALFMMAGAYTLSKGEHVRGDFMYQRWSPTTQAKVDLVLYLVFFFPGITAMIVSGFEYGSQSMLISEVSVNSPADVPVWPLKLIIFFAGITLFLQGLAEVFRCLVCLEEGRWPDRISR